MNQQWRYHFEQEAFGVQRAAATGTIIASPAKRLKSKMLTKSQWNTRVEYLLKFHELNGDNHDGDDKALVAFRKSFRCDNNKNKQIYEWERNSYVTTNSLGQHSLYR